MPRAKAKKTPKSKVSVEKISEPISSRVSLPRFNTDNVANYFPSKKVSIALIALGLLAILYLNKNWFIAATVNGKPVLTSELNKRMNDTYRSQVLNQIINEKILDQEAKNKGVNISDQQVNDKIKQLEDQYGGADSFNTLLSQQGLTRDQFIQQTKLQLTVEELYKDQINPNDDEIKKFMDENSSLPEATDPAKFRETAIDQLKQQKLSDVFSQKFQELRSSANIQIF